MMVFYKTIFEIDVVKKPMAFLTLSPTYLRWFLKTLLMKSTTMVTYKTILVGEVVAILKLSESYLRRFFGKICLRNHEIQRWFYLYTIVKFKFIM